MKREVTKNYGVLNDEAQFASRTTFVVDKDGKIQHIQEGSGAIDPTDAIDICTDISKEGYALDQRKVKRWRTPGRKCRGGCADFPPE